MPRVLSLLLALGAVPILASGQGHVWQADLQIRSLTVSELKGNLTAKVVVVAEFQYANATARNTMPMNTEDMPRALPVPSAAPTRTSLIHAASSDATTRLASARGMLQRSPA